MEINEQERLENKAQELKEELKNLNFLNAKGDLKDDSIIKEKKQELVNTLVSLELSKINEIQEERITKTK